jgi:TolB-like protein
MLKQIYLLLITFITLFISLYPNQHFTGDGARGTRIAVLIPDGVGLPNADNHLPSLVQQVLTSDLSRYSAMSVLDRMNLEKVLLETESGIYKNEADFGRLGQIVKVDYALTGSITRTGLNYTLNIQIIRTTTDIGTVRATYVGTTTREEIENHIGIRRASIDLLSQMGVNLTTNARTELTRAETEARQRASNALAHGHVAQRQGTEISALSYFFQAQAFDPTTSEAVSRSSIIQANIRNKNIGMDVRNEIAWRRQWVQRLEETERFFHKFLATNSMPHTLYYVNDIRQGTINWENETVTISIPGIYLRAHEIWLNPIEKTLQEVYNGLHGTGRAKDWQLSNWPYTGVTDLKPFKRRDNNFAVVFELVNDNNRVIGRSTVRLSGNWEINSSGHPSFTINTNSGYTVPERYSDKNNISWIQPQFTNVRAHDITDNLTIRVATINGAVVSTEVITGNLQVQAISLDDYQRMVRRHPITKAANKEARMAFYSTILLVGILFLGILGF